MSKTSKKVFIVKVSLSSAQSQRCVEQCRFYFVQCQGQSEYVGRYMAGILPIRRKIQDNQLE